MITEFILVCLLVIVAFQRRNPVASFKKPAAKTPEEHLTYLVQYMRGSGILPAQVTEAWERIPAAEDSAQKKREPGKILATMMFFLGALFVFAGVGIYIASFWDEMSSFMRVLMTLGVGIALFSYSLIMVKEKKHENIFLPLIIMGILFEAGGWFVLQHEIFPQGGDPRKAALACFAVMSVQLWGVFQMLRREWLAFLAIAFTYAALDTAMDLMGIKQQHIAVILGGSLFVTAYMASGRAMTMLADLLYVFSAAWFGAGLFATIEEWSGVSTASVITGAVLFAFAEALKRQERLNIAMLGYVVSSLTLFSGVFMVIEEHTSSPLAAIITGLSVCSLGYGFVKQETYANLGGLCYLIGSAVFYAGLFDQVQNTPLELLYFAVGVSMMYGSTVLHSRALLFTSMLAILGFIGYYTTKHFMHSAGWPVALMIMGVAFLAVGSVAVRIKRKYL